MNTDNGKVLGAVPEAENLIITTDKRLFASGSDGLYQVDPDGSASPQKIPIAFDTTAQPTAGNHGFFCGITQYRHFIYATCSSDLHDPASPRYIMLMDLSQTPLSAVAIHQVSHRAFFNGLACDAAGNLYATCAGTLIPPRAGMIVKFSMASPANVAGHAEWLEVDGHPNGIRIDGDTVYFSYEPPRILGYARVKKTRIKSDGMPDMPITVYTAGMARILDDIELVDGGLLITQAGLIDSLDPSTFHNSRFNRIIHISESGQELHASDALQSPPSAVRLMPDSTSPSPDLIVTERAGRVVRLDPQWGLRPRH